jgi:Zn-dependent M16 (insulinase) family peptidase
MNFVPGKTYHGFLLREITPIEEIKSKGYLLTHQKTNLTLFFLENEDDNKVFTITFKTPPPDSTGCPHILEHSVLCGSTKFPSKDPFMELSKGSLNTFLNAMTSPDNTSYPFASRNHQDFHNLMDVYLDAVFHPTLVKEPKILQQEGWHFHLENPEDELKIQGVVYNEMKGAYSSPEAILYKKIQESLYPDTFYGLDSGGDPDVIPHLTQENFVKFHEQYYHPSNAIIVLYGNGSLDEYLSFIDAEYLSHYDALSFPPPVTIQKPFTNRIEQSYPYPISPEEDSLSKDYFALTFAIDPTEDTALYYALSILIYLLVDSPSGIIKKELLDKGIGADVLSYTNTSLPQPMFGIAVKHVRPDQKEEFIATVLGKLKDLAITGIPKKTLEASINHFEFGLREAEFYGFPKGLYYTLMMVMDGLLYRNNPTLYLTYDPLLATIRKSLTEPYFEKIIQKYLINNFHSTLIHLYPSQTYSAVKAEEESSRLKSLKAHMTEKEITELVSQTNSLLAYQREEDPKETKEKIPQLALSDISTMSDTFPLTLHDIQGVKTLHHDVVTNGISYLKLLFPIDSLPIELYPYCSLLGDVLGSMDTSTHSYEDLTNEINIHMGDMIFDPTIYTRFDNDEEFKGMLTISSKYLTGNTKKAIALIKEVLLSTNFTSKKRLREIMMEQKSAFEMKLIQSGNAYALMRLFSYLSPSAYLTEQWKGIENYMWLSEKLQHFDAEADRLLANLDKTLDLLIRKPGMIISLTSSPEDFSIFEDKASYLLEDIPSSESTTQTFHLPVHPNREALLTQANVQYNAMGFNYRQMGGQYSGHWQVAHSILSLDYLYNQIRVQGGAYGAGSKMTRNGLMGFWSYRDPKISGTFDVYKKAHEYLSSFDVDPREMTKYIIGTIATVDYPLTPPKLGEKALSFYLAGMTWERMQQEREEILSTKPGDIRACAELVREVTSQNCYCSLGNEKMLKDNATLFQKMTQVNR